MTLASTIALLLFPQTSHAHQSSTPVRMATVSLRTTCVTSSTTVGIIQMRTPTYAVRPSHSWVLTKADYNRIALTDCFLCCNLSEGFSGRCNFEFDLCSWRQCQEDDFDWLIKAGSTPTVGTGPSNDHTLRDPSGHYLYLESSFPQAISDTARIIGPLLSSRSSNCKVRVTPKRLREERMFWCSHKKLLTVFKWHIWKPNKPSNII